MLRTNGPAASGQIPSDLARRGAHGVDLRAAGVITLVPARRAN